MSDVLDGTELASATLPDGVTGLGGIELAYLLARHQGPSSERSIQNVPLPAEFYSEEMQNAALSTLLARGYVEVTSQSIEARSAAALIEYAAGRADKWIRIGHVDSSSQFAALLCSPEVTALVHYYAYDAWYCSFASGCSDFTNPIVEMFDERLPLGTDMQGYLSLIGLLAPERNVFVKHSADDVFEVNERHPETGESSKRSFSRSELSSYVAELLDQ